MERDIDFKAKTTSTLKNMSRMFGELCTEFGSTMLAMEADVVDLYSGFVEEVIPMIFSRPNNDIDLSTQQESNTECHENLPSQVLTDDESLVDTPSTQTDHDTSLVPHSATDESFVNKPLDQINNIDDRFALPQKLEDSSSSAAEGVGYDFLVDARCDSESLKSDDFFSVISDYGNSEEEDSSEGETEEEDEEESSEGEVEGEREYSSEEDEEDSSEGEGEYGSEEEEDSSEGEVEGEGESSSEEEEEEQDSSEGEEEEEYNSKGEVQEGEDSSEGEPVGSSCVTELDMEFQSFEKDMIVFSSRRNASIAPNQVSHASLMLWQALWEVKDEEEYSGEGEAEEEEDYSSEGEAREEEEEEDNSEGEAEEEEVDCSEEEDSSEGEVEGEGESSSEEEEEDAEDSSEGEVEREGEYGSEEKEDSSEGELEGEGESSSEEEEEEDSSEGEPDGEANIAPNEEKKNQILQTTLYDIIFGYVEQSHDLVEKKSPSPETPKSNEEEEEDDDGQFPSQISMLKRLEVLISCAEGVNSGISRSQLPRNFCFSESLSEALNVATLPMPASLVDARFDGESVKSDYLSSDANYRRSDDGSSEEGESDDSSSEGESDDSSSEGESDDSSSEGESDDLSSEVESDDDSSCVTKLDTEVVQSFDTGVVQSFDTKVLQPFDDSEGETDDDSSCVTNSSVDARFDGESVKFGALSSDANYGRSDDSSEGEEPEDDSASDLDIEELIKAFEEELEDHCASDLNIEELIQAFQKELNESSNDSETMEVLGNQFQSTRTTFYDFYSGYSDGVEELIPLISTTNPINLATLDSCYRHDKFPYEATIDELLVYMPLEQRYDTNLVTHATTDELVVNLPLQQSNDVVEEKNISPETPKSNEEEDCDQFPWSNSVIKGDEDLISCEGVHSVPWVAVHLDGESGDSYSGDAEDDCVAEEAFGKEVDEEAFEKEETLVVEENAPADQSDSDWEILDAEEEEEGDYNQVRKEENVRLLTRIGRLFR